MLYRSLLAAGLLTVCALANATDYVVSHAIVEDVQSSPKQVILILYAVPEGGEALEVHKLLPTQWRVRKAGETNELQAFIDTDLPRPLWAEIRVNDRSLGERAALNAPGNLTAQGEIQSQTGFRFPDNSLQTSAADTEALGKVFGGSSSCPAGSSIRAIDANGDVTCETDDGGTGVTRIETGAGLEGGPITATGTISIAQGGIDSGMIHDASITSADIKNGEIGALAINQQQVQLRAKGYCAEGQLLRRINTDGSFECASIYDVIPLPPRNFIVDSRFDVGKYSSLALNSHGNPIVSYYDVTNSALKVVFCNDPACAGNDEETVTLDSAGNVGIDPSIVLDGNDNPVISYIADGKLKVARCTPLFGSCTPATTNIVDDSGIFGNGTSIALDANGYAIVSYVDTTSNHRLKLAHCSDASCSASTIRIVEAASVANPSMRLDSAGYPVVAYEYVGSSDVRLARCHDVNCNSKSLATVASKGGSIAFAYPSLTLNAENPVLAYAYQASSVDADVKVLVCNDPVCDGNGDFNITLDSVTGTFSALSLELGQGGQPVLSYIADDNTANDTLLLTRCAEAACFSITKAVVDAGVDMGWVSSLALDAADHPAISYYDNSAHDLRVAKCATADCR